VDSPFSIDGADKIKPGAAPELGEHTREILQEAGYPEKKIRDLLDRGIAGQK
jgi:formyl-CoA transferase